MLTSRYSVAGRGVVSESFDGDLVVLDLDSGRYFSFTDSGCGLWEALVEGVAPEALLTEGAIYTTDEVRSFLRELVDYRLLVAVADAPVAAVSGTTAEKLSRAKDKPTITVFDDLADLFLVDPIHDVEEGAGWPALSKD